MSAEISTSQPTQNNPQYYPVEFRGDGMEYTKLILVNTALSILTLGIFSAWAKVRTKKYIYGNTYINGANFNYHGDPIQILKGRLLVGALFIMYGFGGHLSIWLPLVAMVIFIVGLPWLFVRGNAFAMNNTSHRNIRFGFKADVKESYKIFFTGYLVTLFTLGLGAPYLYQRVSEFRVKNSRFGSSFFKPRFSVGDFFNVYIRVIGVYFLAILAGGLFIGISAVGSKVAGSSAFGGIGMGVGILTIYAGLLFAVAVFQAGMFNLVYSMTEIEQIKFKPVLKSTTLYKIYIQNIFFGIFTLGFGIPYGMYRIIAYKAKNLALVTDPAQFEQFIAVNSADSKGAVADAAGDFWDFDVGF